jgi:hypothetical protein
MKLDEFAIKGSITYFKWMKFQLRAESRLLQEYIMQDIASYV